MGYHNFFENILTIWGDNVGLKKVSSFALDKNLTRKEAENSILEYCGNVDVSKDVVTTVAGVIKENIDYSSFEEGGYKMSSLFGKISQEERAEGIIKTCLDFQASKEVILQKLQKELNITEQQAEEYYNKFSG